MTPLFVGVDVGGTNIKIGVVDDEGRTIAKTKFPTMADKEPSLSMEKAKQSIGKLLADSGRSMDDVAAVGLGTPGPMDIRAGVILTPSNLPGWRNDPVRDILSKATGKPVTYANDAAAAAFGEFWIGSGRQYDSLVLITLGTGVGGGIIVDNVSIDGAHSHGAEIGHMTIDTSESARPCPCGQIGHLEAYASATAVVARCSEALAGGASSLLTQEMGEASPLSALMISQAADKGDELSLSIIDETAKYLGHGIAALAHVIDPEAFILGGAMDFGGSTAHVGRRFIDGVIAETRRLVFPVLAEELVVCYASLGGDAGYIGAAGLARVEFLKGQQA
ncbi:ROK family protein [Mariniblastus fucicola]|uniref:ROK family protein n=1 Tax=Mariniblastus fucicola TaxID=980251 RepID=UPI001EE46F41|nr:ROK family protein [Mariniblastus fucicola]